MNRSLYQTNSEKREDMGQVKTYMTRYIVSLFKEIIERERTIDVPYLTYVISTQLEDKYDGPYLESKLERIGLNTTTDIRNALFEFFETREGFLKKLGLIGSEEDA